FLLSAYISPPLFLLFMTLPPPSSTLFPYTTLFRSLCLLLGFSLVFGASAQIYKTVDKDGKVIYTDKPPADQPAEAVKLPPINTLDRKSTRLNSSHVKISYAVFCLKKKKRRQI